MTCEGERTTFWVRLNSIEIAQKVENLIQLRNNKVLLAAIKLTYARKTFDNQTRVNKAAGFKDLVIKLRK